MLGSLIDEGTGLIQSVADEVVPGVVDAMDLNQVVEKIDIQAIVERVDLNAVLGEIDMNALLEGVDIEKLIARVDVNALLSQVDIDELIAQTHMGNLIARSGGAMAAKATDVVRDHGARLDFWVQRGADRLLRRRATPAPSGPPRLLARQQPSTS